MGRVTLKAVAARAGVSYQTVSNVLNDSAPVRGDTRARVLAAIEALDYQPHFAARALREARSMTLACPFFEPPTPELSDPYRNLLLSAVLAEAAQARYSVLSQFLTRAPDSLQVLRRGFQQRRFDGAIVVGSVLDPTTLDGVAAWDMPSVLLDHSDPPGGFDSVAAQYAEGMAQVVAHLHGRGARRVALVVPSGDRGSTAVERQRAFLEGARQHGLEALLEDGDWTAPSGERALHRLMAGPAPPDAVVAANDRMALGCLTAAQALGLRVPDDVAVCGFDGFETGRYSTPALTSVEVPYAEMATLAVRMLLERLADPALPPRQVRLPVSLRPRAST